MSLWSALTSSIASLRPRARDADHRQSYVTESSPTEVAQHVALAPNRAWRKLTGRWRRSLQRDPNSARILNNLGVAYEQQGLFQSAEECYRKALDLAPDNAYIRRNYELFKRAIERRARV